MNYFAETHRFWIVALSAALFVGAGTASSTAQTNSTFNANSSTNGNAATYSTAQTAMSSQDQSQWPTIAEVLSSGSDAGSLSVSDLADVWANVRFHVFSDYEGKGAYDIRSLSGSTEADFSVVTGAGDFFAESQAGDMCLRSLGGPIRLGCWNSALSYNSSLVVATNGDVTVTQGTLYLTPQGDLLMGSFTNSPPH